MDARHHNNTDQTTLWNEVAGRAWVDAEALVDHVYRPFEHLLVEAVPPSAARILDVGCGTGATTLAAARKIGEQGLAVGIDVSEPMIAAARARAERHGVSARFIRGDAQRHAFEPASFDAIISRFGVMFFDGAVSAFRNLRRAAAEHAALTIVVWRSADENPFMTTAERAAARSSRKARTSGNK